MSRIVEGLGADPGSTESLWKVALGQEPPDTVVSNARVFDAVSGDFVAERSLWIKDGRIARVAPSAETPAPGGVEIDVGGLTLVPGLIDGHTHAVRLFVPEFVRALLPTGVTGAVIETMEYGATEGMAGIRLFVDALRDQPLRLYYTAPALCGLTQEEEPAPLTPDELEELLADPMCLGLGEVYWSNALLPGAQGRRVRAMMAQTLAAGKVVEGHTAGAKGARLDAYVGLGVSSCHEPVSVDEALEVYSRGLFVMLRHGSIRRDLETLRPLFDLPLDFRRFALVTDSVDPVEMASWGYLDQVVREALALDIPPHVVYRMAGTNVAEHFRLEGTVGHLAPGRWADLVAIPSPGEFEPVFVMVGGTTVAERARVRVAARPVVVPKSLLTTVRVDAARALESAGPPPALPASGRVRVIEYVTNLVTRETLLTASEATEEDLMPVLAIERTRGERSFWGLLKGLGLSEGAYATTVTWDSPDLVVVGRDHRSALTALGRVVELGGGGVYAVGEEVVAEVASPVCGIASLEPAERVRADLSALVAALCGAGVAWEDPLLAIDTLTTPAIPHLRISHRGYVRLRDRALLPLEVEEG
ncbi:MAG: amidohydrolase family protein [Actinobacteria bacterium]|nr:amidohydrolase family protein [Actinomycetota bacterium]